MRILQLLLVALFCSSFATAQKPAGVATSERLGAGWRERVFFDESAEGVLWARGADWKASLGADGFRFIPFLGSAAPRNFPVAWRLAVVRVGGSILNVADDLAPRRDGMRFEIDRGVVVERYDLSPRSVEQSFVLRERPAATGELVIEMDVQSELAARPEAGGYRFENEEWGGVTYGKALAVDAQGRRTPMSMQWVGGRLKLVLDAAAFEAAAFPLTIDPVITTYTYTTAAIDQLFPDLASNYQSAAALETFLVVCEETYSAADHDILAVKLNIQGQPTGATAYVDFTSNFWSRPRVASNNLAAVNAPGKDYLVVAHVLGSPTRVWGRMVGAVSLALGTQFQISPVGLSNASTSPDVGGDPQIFSDNLGGSYFCVVWEYAASATDHDIYGCFVSAAGAVVPGSLFSPNFTLDNEFLPRISKSCGRPTASGNGSGRVWTIVWERDSSAFVRDVYAAQMNVTTGFVGAVIPIATAAGLNYGPTVSTVTDDQGGIRRCMVAWQRTTGPGVIIDDVLGAVIENSVVVASSNLTSLENVPFGVHQLRPCVATDGCRFAVAYAEDYPFGVNDFDIYAATFRYDGSQIVCDDAHQNLAYSSTLEDSPQIASVFSVGGGSLNHHEYVSAWTDATTAVNHDIEGGLYAGMATGGGVATVSTGCAPLQIYSYGEPVLGGLFTAGLIGGTGAIAQFLWVGAPESTPIPVCGSCSLGVVLPPLIEITDVQTFPLDPFLSVIIPCESLLAGLTVALQGAAIGVTNGCPYNIGGNFFDIALTDTLLVTFR